MTRWYLALGFALAVTLGSSASAQIDLAAVAAGVQGCPELAADPGLGTLAAYLCTPLDRTSLDLPIRVGLPPAIEVRAGAFAIATRQSLLNLARSAIGDSEYLRLRGLLFQGEVLSRSEMAVYRALRSQAADPATPPAYAASLNGAAAAVIHGTFDESIPELLAARSDRNRAADLLAGRFAKVGGSNTIGPYGGMASGVSGQLGGAPFVADADGYPVFSAQPFSIATVPFFVGPDGIPNTADDLPYLRTKPVSGLSLAPPISGTDVDRFDQGAPFPFYSETAQVMVPSLADPNVQKRIEIYGVFSNQYKTLIGCQALGGTFSGSSVCTDSGGHDVSDAARDGGCPVIARQYETSRPQIGVNADGDCIEVNVSNGDVSGALVQVEVLEYLATPGLRSSTLQEDIEPSDLTDLRIRSFLLPARPAGPNGTAVFPPVSGGFRRGVDPLTGAPVSSTGDTCRLRLNASAVPIGPNGVAGDGDDIFPSTGECLLWGPPDAGGAQHLRSPGAVAATHAANQTLFHELCSAGFDEDVAHCPLDQFNDPNNSFLAYAIGGLGAIGSAVLSGTETIRIPSHPLDTIAQVIVSDDFKSVQFLEVNPLGGPNPFEQDLGLNLERGQAALLGCGADFVSPCSSEQARLWYNDPAISGSIGSRFVGGIDLLNADASVFVQEFATVKALRSGELVGTSASASDPNAPLAYLPGVNFSRDGTLVAIPNTPGNSPQFAFIETGQYLSLTPSDVLGMSEAQRATYQHGGANKVQADGWVEKMPWALDPDALATFGAVVFQSDPNDPLAGPGNVFNHAGGAIDGEYCGRWMNVANAADDATPFNAGCTALETASANLERLILSGEVIGADRVFDPPESLAELAAMLDDDPSNDATGDPISGPDGIFSLNQFVFRDDEMDFQVLVARQPGNTQLVVAPANKADALLFLQSYDPNVSCTATPECLLQVNAVLSDPNDAHSAFPLVLALPIGFTVDVVPVPGDPNGPTPPNPMRKVNLAKLAYFDRATLNHLFAGQPVVVDGVVVEMSANERARLFGSGSLSVLPRRDINGDLIEDLDQDHDGIWDGADDHTPGGPVSDDEVLCGSGIRGDTMLEEGIQYEPYRAADAPGSPAFQSLFPHGLPPRSPTFCRELNGLLGLVGVAPGGRREFVWHQGVAAGTADQDGDSWPDALDNCPSMPNATQSDVDGDAVGDDCDNCVYVANPRRPADYLAQNPWATLTGGQRDDDRDGFGNTCDADFTPTGVNVGTLDLRQINASLGKSRAESTCGTSGDRPCAVFDLDEGSATNIGAGDLVRMRALFGRPAGAHAPPGSGKCPTCPLACSAGSAASCP